MSGSGGGDLPMWKPTHDKPYALYIGGGGNRKGFDVLTDAVSSMKHRN